MNKDKRYCKYRRLTRFSASFFYDKSKGKWIRVTIKTEIKSYKNGFLFYLIVTNCKEKRGAVQKLIDKAFSVYSEEIDTQIFKTKIKYL